jgi:hypothetical protein
MEIEVTNYEGDTFTATISNSSVIENPLAKDKCSPCSCATCLPQKICVKAQFYGDAYTQASKVTATYTWDCSTRSWKNSSPPDGLSVSISLKSAADGVCGINFNATYHTGSVESDILLESPLNSRKFHGTVCMDSDNNLSMIGVPELHPCLSEPCDDPGPQAFLSYIDEAYNLTDYGGEVVGHIIVRDQSCGTCDPECSDPFPNRGVCCVEVPKFLTITVHVTGPRGCDQTRTLTLANAAWPTSYAVAHNWAAFCDPPGDVNINVGCELDLIHFNEFTIGITAPSWPFGGGARNANTVLCPGILVQVSIPMKWFNFPVLEEYIFNITVTR